MGIVARDRMKEGNQRVAQARTLEVRFGAVPIQQALEQLFARWNAAADVQFAASQATGGCLAKWANSGQLASARHYTLCLEPTTCWSCSACQCSESSTADSTLTTTAGSRRSMSVRLRSRNLISVCLTNWGADDNGVMWNGGRYVAMLDGFVDELAGRYTQRRWPT